LYVVEPSRPVSLNVVVVEVPTCAKLLGVLPQLALVQRSIKYWLIVPPVSVEAVQDKLICTGPEAVAVKFAGAVGVGTGTLPAALKETICMIQAPDGDTGAVAL